MRVVATAGHVDHGKSTLVRALTGMEPDRWAEERRRGMTIDLGYAWTELAGRSVAFVDVPGHERFIANTLAGLGPAPAVLMVVAADQGWQAQSSEHLAAITALGLEHLLVVVTRSDLADPAPATAAAGAACRSAGLPDVPVVAASAASGTGLAAVRDGICRLVDGLPTPRVTGRVRIWVDRAFTIAGAGTVVTATLTAGTVPAGDRLALRGRSVGVRGLQVAGRSVDQVQAPARVALNLRGVAREDVGRGDVLLTPDAWSPTDLVDVRLTGTRSPAVEQVLHVGTAAVPVHVRPLGADTARLRLTTPLPLVHGDRAVLRDPGSRAIAGVSVLDAQPPPLIRRGAAARRAAYLAGDLDATTELARRGAVRRDQLSRLGFDPAIASGREVGEWLVDEAAWTRWTQALRDTIAAQQRRDPLRPGVGVAAVASAIGLPDVVLATALAAAAGLTVRDGTVTAPDAVPALGAAEPALAELERRLRADPFAAPEQPQLEALGLGRREVAVAVRTGRLLSLPGGVLLLPDAPARAVRRLTELMPPFTASAARAALGTTRRVAIPLLEHLDSIGLTERVDASSRRLRAPAE